MDPITITDVINEESVASGPDVEEQSDGDVPDFGNGE